MLKTLIKKQLLELFQTYFIDKKTGKKRSGKSTVFFLALLAFLFIMLGFVFYNMAGTLAAYTVGTELSWLYFALMGLVSAALGVFGSVFNTYASLYLPKDNELLLSLPIPNEKLLLSRLSGVYATSLMYTAWVWIPAVIAYFVTARLTVTNIIFPILLTFIIPLFVSILSCILGWVVALVAVKAKGKTFVTVFFSLLVVVLYYVVYFKIVNSISDIIGQLGEIGAKVKSWLYYVYILGKAGDGEIVPMLIFTAITLAAAALCFFVLSKTFTKLALAGGSTSKKGKSKDDYSANTVQRALLKRELKHFTSVSSWMLNGGLGLLILPVAAVAAIIKSDSVFTLILQLEVIAPNIANALPLFLAMAACFLVSVNLILPVSVSIEGKTLWQLQSLPVDPRAIIQAKESMGVLLNVFPAMFFTFAAGFVMRLEFSQLILSACAVLIYIFMISDFGLLINLKMPDFNWKSEVAVVKQGMPVTITLFSGWVFCALLAVGGFFLCKMWGITSALVIYIVLFSIIRMALNKWLRTKGAEIFKTL